jgi:arsenite methyltransferase
MVLRRRSCPAPAGGRPRWPRRASTAVMAPVGRYLSRQARAPHGAVGRLMGRIWVNETAAVNDIAIELLRPAPGERICEIGFGPGRTVQRLAAAGAEVVGVEVSSVMVDTAARRNAAAFAAGHVQLFQGNGTTVPVVDDSLDAVVGVHTIYFWPEPTTTLHDLARALRPGGRLVLAFRAGEHPLPARFDPTVYHAPTTTQVTIWLDEAGFTDVHVEHRPHLAFIVWVTAKVTEHRCIALPEA